MPGAKAPIRAKALFRLFETTRMLSEPSMGSDGGTGRKVAKPRMENAPAEKEK